MGLAESHESDIVDFVLGLPRPGSATQYEVVTLPLAITPYGLDYCVKRRFNIPTRMEITFRGVGDSYEISLSGKVPGEGMPNPQVAQAAEGQRVLPNSCWLVVAEWEPGAEIRAASLQQHAAQTGGLLSGLCSLFNCYGEVPSSPAPATKLLWPSLMVEPLRFMKQLELVPWKWTRSHFLRWYDSVPRRYETELEKCGRLVVFNRTRSVRKLAARASSAEELRHALQLCHDMLASQ